MAETLREVFGEAAIAARVAELGRELSAHYAGKDVVMVGVLKGALPFMADLLRALDFCPVLDFIRVASYGSDTAPGQLRFLMDLQSDIAGRHVLLVEDIVDTGRSLSYLLEILSRRNPASIKICTFLDKAYRREVDVTADFVGFPAPPVYLVGYGMDIGERLRRLRGVYELIG